MCFFSLPLIFTFNSGSQHFPFSHRRDKFFMFFFQRNWYPLVFISRSSSFSVVHVNEDIEIKLKERIGFVVVVFISKRPGSYSIYRRNARLLEMQHLIQAYMKGWTVRTDLPRGCNRLPNFLTQGAPLRARQLRHHYLQWLQMTCQNHVNLALDSFSQK